MSSSGSLRRERAPVLVLGFNRPDLLEKVLNVVRTAGPRELFVSLDGPRDLHPSDAQRCARVRCLVEAIDWADELHLNFRETNIGCAAAVPSGIDWALSHTQRVIILEDDCLPDPSFFPFCDELLERFVDDRRVMHIAASNWGASTDRFHGYSYSFNSFAPNWGWATWRRAWELYEFRLDSWPRFKDDRLIEGIAVSRRFRNLMRHEWDTVYGGGGTWDHQWQYALMSNSGLSVTPNRNLCVNVGFRPDATGINEPDYVFSKLPLESMDFPLCHPPEMARNPAVEALFEKVYWSKLAPPIRLYRRLIRDERIRRQVRRITQNARTRPT